jgi:hypothetical protein
MSDAPVKERMYRIDPTAPLRLEIPLAPSPWAASATVVPMLKWAAMITTFVVLGTVLSPYLTPQVANVVLPVIFLSGIALFIANMYRRKPGPSLVLIERTLHRLDPRGAIIESIADVRGEITPAVWSFTVKGTTYYGRALLLRFASGPLAVSLYPQPQYVDGAPCDTPSWIIEPAHYERLLDAAR